MDKIVSKKLPISHFFSTRHDGVSKSPFDSNNIALHVGDDAEAVMQNRAALLKEIDAAILLSMNQVHSDRVVVVDDRYDFKALEDCDALLTSKKGLALMVMVADCTPLILYDTRQACVAVVHVGRAGAFLNITARTIEKMQTVYQSQSKDIIAVLGPSIYACCYEVNEAIAKEAEALGYGFAISYKNGSVYLDVNAIIHHQLLTCKIEQIDDIGLCSACNSDRFFSYRADKQQTGRFCAVVKL